MPAVRHRAAVLLLAGALLATACDAGTTPTIDDQSFGTDRAEGTVIATATEADAAGDDPIDPGSEDTPEAEVNQKYPDVVKAELVTEAAEDTFTLHVTISSPYDSPDRYADAFRALAPDGTELGVRELAHDHADEQPFTRSLTGLVIPAAYGRITVEARDLEFGWGGSTITLDVPGRTNPDGGPAPSGTAKPPPDPEPTPSESASENPAGETVITEQDSGREFAFSRDTQAVLRLHPDRGTWSEPRVEGGSIELAERLFFTDPGYREWEIRVVREGDSRITSTSDPCPGANPPCGAPSFLFEVTITVS